MKRTYQRGEMYYADLGRGVGSEQEGRRPVVIIPVSYTHLDVYTRQTHYIAKRIRQTNKWMWTAICTV